MFLLQSRQFWYKCTSLPCNLACISPTMSPCTYLYQHNTHLFVGYVQCREVMSHVQPIYHTPHHAQFTTGWRLLYQTFTHMSAPPTHHQPNKHQHYIDSLSVASLSTILARFFEFWVLVIPPPQECEKLLIN